MLEGKKGSVSLGGRNAVELRSEKRKSEEDQSLAERPDLKLLVILLIVVVVVNDDLARSIWR